MDFQSHISQLFFSFFPAILLGIVSNDGNIAICNTSASITQLLTKFFLKKEFLLQHRPFKNKHNLEPDVLF